MHRPGTDHADDQQLACTVKCPGCSEIDYTAFSKNLFRVSYYYSNVPAGRRSRGHGGS